MDTKFEECKEITLSSAIWISCLAIVSSFVIYSARGICYSQTERDRQTEIDRAFTSLARIVVAMQSHLDVLAFLHVQVILVTFAVKCALKIRVHPTHRLKVTGIVVKKIWHAVRQ